MDAAVEAAKEAGSMIKAAFEQTSRHADFKNGDPNDLVTETDMAVEEMLFGRLKTRFPHHK